MSCGVGCRLGLDPKLLWLWCRPAAVALVLPLACEPPYAEGAALKSKKKKKKAKTQKKTHRAAPQVYTHGPRTTKTEDRRQKTKKKKKKKLKPKQGPTELPSSGTSLSLRLLQTPGRLLGEGPEPLSPPPSTSPRDACMTP